jgi:hypothetical protein
MASAAACSSEWDRYDPRLGDDGAGAEGGASAGGAGGGSGGAASGGSGQGGSGLGGGSGLTGGGAGASGGGGAGGGGAGGTGGVGGGGGAGPGTVVVGASIADCLDPTVPDPDQCELDHGVGIMTVDGSDGLNGLPVYSFLRFDLDDTLTGKTVTAVTLRLTVPDTGSGDSPESGEVWEVEPFSRQDLFTAAPLQVGGAPLAMSQGAVALLDEVTWALPGDSVAPNSAVTLGLYPLVNDGADYWNLNGTLPPQLVIDYQ